MKISVIVTIHNAQRYIRECLDSVIRQTFSDIEILCMDGGSSDETPDILREYAEKDKRIRIVNDTNTSYGHKVNEGIKLAQGQYISVLESDDIYQDDMLERLYEVMEEYRTDFVDADYLEFRDVAGSRYYTLVKMYRDEDYGRLLKNREHPEKMRHILRYWTGLFRKDFLLQNNIWMNESPGASFQDMSFRFLTSALAETAYHINEPVYLYRRDNPDSSMNDSKKAVITADEFNYLKSELEKRKITNEYIWQHFYVWKYQDLYANLTHFNQKAREDLWQRTYQELELDRSILIKNQYWKNSPAIDRFLCRSKQEVAQSIEDKFRDRTNDLHAQEWFYEQLQGKSIVIFGCGILGKSLLKWLTYAEDRVLCLTDNARTLWGTKCNGYQVLSPEEAVERYPHALFVVANKLWAEEIKKQLIGMGVEAEQMLVYNSEAIPQLYERKKRKTEEEQLEEITRAIKKGLLYWYDFRKGADVLYIGGETDAWAEVLREKELEVVCMSMEQVTQCACQKHNEQRVNENTFDYLICVGTLEQQADPLEILKIFRMLLKPTGRLLLGMNNRYGLRYFCGDRDIYTERSFDGVEGYRRAYVKEEDIFKGRCYSKAEMNTILQDAGFVKSRFYSVLTDLDNPVLLYGEDFLPNEDLANRIFPTYHYPETIFLEEESLYSGLIENGMFHAMANAYLVECPLDGSCSDVLHVTSSMTRGREDALVTTIHKSGTVEKRAVYPEGQERLNSLLANGRELATAGIPVLDAGLEGGVYRVPYIEGETGQLYLKHLLEKDKNAFLHAMDHFRDMILQSSEIVKQDQGDGLGATLKKGYIDMVPLNSFYQNGTFVFYDQEFCGENYPANALIWRMVATFYAGDLGAQKLLPMEQLLERYGLSENMLYWQRMELSFLKKLRRDAELKSYYESCRRNSKIVNTNRSRINYSTDDYQRLFVDIFHNADTRKLILFGSGKFTKLFLSMYGHDYPAYAIIDNNPEKWGQELSGLDDMDGVVGADGIKIQSPELLKQLHSGEYKVLICIKNYLSVMHQLDEMGISEYSVYDPARNYPRKRHPITWVSENEEGQAAMPKKYHTGYIAGVFDLFHIGHLNMFKRAKEQCEYLIVGVMLDEGVRQYKKTDSFIPFEERIEMVRSCRYVDEVVPIPLKYGKTIDAWRLFHFDCQFSGSDYMNNPEWLADKRFLEEHGAELVFFPYTEQTSSTKIKNLIERGLV